MDFLEKINKILKGFFSSLSSFFGSKKQKNTGEKIIAQHDIEKKLVLSLSKSRIPTWRQIRYVKKYLNHKEVFLIRVSIFVIVFSSIFLLVRFYMGHLETVPVRGGTYTEGVVGAPKFINPLYSVISDIDNDIASLVFSSLFDRDKNGKLVQDLVKSYVAENDGKSYVVELRDDAYWHDGKKVTVDDVIFTFNLIKDKKFNSPLRVSFIGVNLDKNTDNKLVFSLSQPYAAFLDLLTFGILQKEAWSQATPESILLDVRNLKPIGSGPFIFRDFVKGEKSGVKQYNLEINDGYYGSKPLVKLSYKFFASYEELINALNSGEVDGVSYLPRRYKQDILVPKTFNFNKLYLPRVNSLFFNDRNNSILADKSVRRALAYAIDKNYIVNQILGGDAYVIDGPILPGSFAYRSDIKKYEYNKGEANKLLDSVDWKRVVISEANIAEATVNLQSGDEATRKKAESIVRVGIGEWRVKNDNFLVVKITLPNTEEGAMIAPSIIDFWTAIGVKAEIEMVEEVDIQDEKIDSKNFEIIFYGQSLGSDPDPYMFWHSSQSAEGGLNISSYSNKEVDQLLEEARKISDQNQRIDKYKRFQEIIVDEMPAIFLYSPSYTYVQNHKIKGFKVENISIPSDRFSNINEWYLETGKKINW